MTVATKYLLTCLVAISMATCWLGCCSARPEYDRTMVAKEGDIYEAPLGHGEGPSEEFGGKLWKNDGAMIENDQWKAKEVRSMEIEPETSENKELYRSSRNPKGLQHSFAPEAKRDDGTFASSRMHAQGTSKALRKKSSTDETSETQIEENSKADELGKFVRSIMDDVNVLTQHSETILNSLKIVLINGPEIGCSDCLSTLSATTDDYDKTRSVVTDFLERGQETAERLTNEPHSRILGVADVAGSELPSGHDVVACATRLKRRLFRLSALARECMSRRDDWSRLGDVEAVEQSITSVEPVGLDVLEGLRTRNFDWSNGGTVNHPASAAPRFYRTSSGSSGTKYYSTDSSATRPYMTPSESSLLTARRSSSDVNEDRVSSDKIAKEIEAFEVLLRFLRAVPTILSEILSLIDSCCSSEWPDEDSQNDEITGPRTEPPYRFEEMVAVTRRPAAAHYPTKMMVAFPPNFGDHSSGSSSSPRNHDDVGPFEPKESDELGHSPPLIYEEHVGAPRIGAPFMHVNGPAPGSHRDLLTSMGPWSSGWSAGNAFGRRSPPKRHPYCFYVNTIRYEGPVNSYGVGTTPDLHDHQHHQPPPFPFEPAMMAHRDFGIDISHNPIDNMALPSESDEYRPPVHHHSYHLKLSLQHGLIALAAFPVRSGDFLALNLGKCSLVGKLDKTASYIELQLVERPIVLLETSGRHPNRIWQVPLVNFQDVVSANTLNKLRRECDRRFAMPSRGYRYVRATTKCAGKYDL